LKNGPLGSQTLNRQARELWSQELESSTKAKDRGPGYAKDLLGQPLLITRNQKVQGIELANGDLGFVGRMHFDQDGKRVTRRIAVLPQGELFVGIPLDEIDGWEAAFAITVHKAQGSEFSKVALVCPDNTTGNWWEHPLWTRQLVYTAITRVKSKRRPEDTLPENELPDLTLLGPGDGSLLQVPPENAKRLGLWAPGQE